MGSFGHVKGGVRGRSREQNPMEGNKGDAQRPRSPQYHLQQEQLTQPSSDLRTGFPYERLYVKITLQLEGTGKPNEARRVGSTLPQRGLCLADWSVELSTGP